MAARSVTFEWNLSPKQAELFNSDARFRVGMMGRRFGKNEVGSAALIDYATQPGEYDFGANENPICWWVAPTYRQAYKYGFLTVKEKLPDILINESETRGSEWGPSQIHLTTGAELEFLSYSNPEGIQGAGVDIIIGDEWAYSDESVWNSDLRPMLMDSGGGAVLISKPLGENHFHGFYQQGQQDDFEDWQSWHATAYENPFIPDSEVDKAKKSTPEGVFRQEYMADPHAGGTVLTLDMLDTVTVDELNDERDWKFTVYVDLGIKMEAKEARESDSDFWAAATVLTHPMEQTAYVWEIVRKRGQSPAQAAEWLHNGLANYPTNRVHFEAVQAQQWFLSDLQDHGLNGIPINPDRPKEERISFLSVPFSNGNVKLVEHDTMDWSDFRSEWASFPGGKHDDQLDALEGALRQIDFNGGKNIFGADPYTDE